ncbi:APC family permease [Nocardioides sp. GY 10113]|uniref:APC family permease n=1 Tax=Nocardioides sp. GY 10113 TaxID=2569761 RepID=UPI0010A84CD3|nr:APC family permease [Nocardioides sp. GY 10113]TIC87839.1 APC family permease [Nocardioides sp. GY 10113]
MGRPGDEEATRVRPSSFCPRSQSSVTVTHPPAPHRTFGQAHGQTHGSTTWTVTPPKFRRSVHRHRRAPILRSCPLAGDPHHIGEGIEGDTPVAVETSGQPGLKRSLSLWAIVLLGLGYMTPTVMFDTFGIVSIQTNGAVTLAYLVALVVMLFTAISYGRMSRVFPSAGSAYTYTRETMNPRLGFLVGWAALLDYLLLPLVNTLIIRIYMTALFPSVPAWVWVVLVIAILTGLNAWSVTSTAKVNTVLVVFAVTMIAVFVALALGQLADGMGTGTLFTTEPLFHEGVHSAAVLTGATVVCFSFIGFDAITMYAEEARDKNIVPKAIVITLLIGGAIFVVSAFVAQAVFPDASGFEVTDDPLPEMALIVGGKLFQLLFVSAAFAATLASGLASHASVSRLLYVMGRNGTLRPARLFGYVHPTRRTPIFSIVVVGAVCLLAITPSLELVASMINFGALVAFSFVNLSVIAHFAVRRRECRTPKQIALNVALPLVSTAMTGVLWSFLHRDALIFGLAWVAFGVVYAIFVAKRSGRDLTDVDLHDDTLEPASA